MTSSRKAQLTESKAFEMSSLRKRLGMLRRRRSFMRFWTCKKLSWMNHFCTKALWHLDTSEGRIGASLLARSLEKIFERL